MFCYWNNGTRTNQPIGSSGLTPPPTLAARSLPPHGWGIVAQVSNIIKPILVSKRRKLQRVTATFRSSPSKPDHTVHIDLIERDSTTCGLATRGALATIGGPSPNRGARTSGAAADVAVKMKGKRMVASIE